MIDRILFPTDGSDGATTVLEHAIEMADVHDAALELLHVVPDGTGRTGDETEEDSRLTEGERFVADAESRAKGSGIETVAEVQRGEPYEAIVDYALAHEADLIVMPTHGRKGLRRLLLGSTTERVVRRSDVPVLTVRPDEVESLVYPYEQILTPTDGSSCANVAVHFGGELAKSTGANLQILSVVNLAAFGADIRGPMLVEQFEEQAETAVSKASTIASEVGVEEVTETTVHDISVFTGIQSYIDDNDIDVVVLGTHGHTGLDRYMLGSVAEKLLRSSPVPVLTVRGPKEE
ncbi:universal stress protein [Haloferax sp. DFSO60]|uniref:universal stress protein n=1 Tax=Haloferax sp. DFSO60 TaxID=3388652 RepID=UPI00397E1E2F